jgi:glutamate:Na+ symporter, ESS family
VSLNHPVKVVTVCPVPPKTKFAMTISPWFAVALALPVLLLGEWLVRRVAVLARFNIPAPVASGLLISTAILIFNLAGGELKFSTKTDAAWWTWLVTTEIEWQKQPALDVSRPFLVAFFTCIGLNASWSLVKKGSVQVLVFLGLAGGLAIFQNVIGVGLAKLMGVSPLLGLVCGSVAMSGGHGTALGFADVLQEAGLPAAGVVGVAAATFGLVCGGLLGGPIGGGLIRKFGLKSNAAAGVHLEAGSSGATGILTDLKSLAGAGRKFGIHFLVLLVCIKLGSWVSYFIQETGITFPVYVGAMLLGLGLRNAVDASGGRWIKTEIVDTLASVMLGVFLAIAMMSLNLIELASAAGPMLVILAVQVSVMALFAWFVTFRLMGRDFDAAVMAGGHCGFGLGATPNAVANMKVLVEKFGPAPRAFLVVPIVGAFLIDFVNATNITIFLNLIKP